MGHRAWPGSRPRTSCSAQCLSWSGAARVAAPMKAMSLLSTLPSLGWQSPDQFPRAIMKISVQNGNGGASVAPRHPMQLVLERPLLESPVGYGEVHAHHGEVLQG